MTIATTTPRVAGKDGRSPDERIAAVAESAYRSRHHALDMGEVQGQGYIGQALGWADVLAVAGAWLTRSWARTAGPGRAGLLLATYLGGFGGSHPLAKRIGAWPSVLAVAAVSGAASWAVADRRA